MAAGLAPSARCKDCRQFGCPFQHVTPAREPRRHWWQRRRH